MTLAGASLLALLASCLTSPSQAFLTPTLRVHASRLPALEAKKGFGKEAPKKEKSEGQKMRDDAQDNYEELKATGVPEYNIFIREMGRDDTSWIPGGTMAVPRSEKVDQAIFANEDALLSGVLRMFPALKTAEAYEYGYNRKVFPDDPIRLAAKPANDFVGNMISKILSPVNTDKMDPKK